MTYSCTDFTDDVFDALAEAGAIHESEANDDNLADNASLQADYALAAIGRFTELRDAANAYRALLRATANINDLAGANLLDAAARLDAALDAVRQPSSPT